MPLYEYQCARCGQRTERIEKVAGPHLKKCPRCGGKVERLIAAPAIQFKGSGWYATDYAGKGAAATEEKPGDSGKAEKPEQAAKQPGGEKNTKKQSKEG